MAGVMAVLGVDLGPGAWANNGSAVLSFDPVESRWYGVELGVVTWPRSEPLTPERMALAIDEFARERGVAAVSLDGPQGWRHPEAPLDRPGVGRACEKSARTPGKTGVEGLTYPADQLGWIRFSISLFDELLRFPHTDLANDPGAIPLASPPAGRYVVLECFPTSTWRSSGLQPLPAKAKRPDLEHHAEALSQRVRIATGLETNRPRRFPGPGRRPAGRRTLRGG